MPLCCHGADMENWLPIFWIIGGGVAFFALLWFVDFLKGHLKKSG